MTEPKLPTGDELRHVVAEVQRWSTPAIGQMLGQLKPSVDSGEAGPATLLAIDVLRLVLGQRKGRKAA